VKKLVVAALTLLSLLALAAPAMARHSWSKYHWARQANPFTVKLGANVDETWRAYLDTTSRSDQNNDWSDDTAGNPVDTTVVAGGSQPASCAPVSGRVEVCNSAYGATGWLGVAKIWLSGSHISQGTAQVNDSYTALEADNTVARGAVMCQEVGHTFGLGHQSTSGADLHTCMDYANVPHQDNMYPNQHDYEQLALIYGSKHGRNPFDGYTSAKSTQATRGEAPYRIDRVDRPRHTEIVEHFSDGSKKVTDIVWAEGR